MLVQLTPAWGATAAPLPLAPSPPTSATAGSARAAGPVTIRPARISDMRAVEPLIRRFAAEQLMLPKPFDLLARTFREFLVATDEAGEVIGCASLRIYTEELAEICSLAVDPGWQGAGIGGRLVEGLVEEAQKLGLTRVFALTLRADFFRRLGFDLAARDEFPLKVWADCRNCPKLHACDETAVAMNV